MALAACSAGDIPFFGDGFATREVTLVGGFKVEAPDGYCIDMDSQAVEGSRLFIALASCRNLGARRGPAPVTPLILSLAVGPLPESGFDRAARDEAATFFASDPGRAALASSGQSEDVAVREVIVTDAGLYIALSDRSGDGAQPQGWRGFLPIAGRLVTLGVRAGRESEFDYGEAEDLMRDFAATLLDLNPDVPQTPSAAPEETTTPAPNSANRSPIGGLWSQIRDRLG